MNRKAMFLIATLCLAGGLETWAQRSKPPGAQAQTQTYHSQEDTDEQLRNLSGRIDVVENQLVQINAARSGDKDSVGKERQAMDQKFVVYEDALKKLEAQIHAMSEDLTKMKLAMEKLEKPPEKPTKAEAKNNPNKAFDEGESLFAQKKFKEAILAYQKYRDNNPKGKHYPDATYKMGVCFQEVGLKDEAKVFFDEVINKFPGSKEAKKAAFRAKQLK